MDVDSFTEVSEEGWFSRIGGAIKGVLTGIGLTIAMVVMLFWNEGRSVDRYKALATGKGAVISVKADKVDPANEGKLVHLNGEATTDDVLSDEEFGISTTAVKLVRKVEMYQWKENVETKSEKKLGGGKKTTKTYTYERAWSDSPIDSSSFKRQKSKSGERLANPKTWAYQSGTSVADTVKLGAFKLSEAQIRSFPGKSEDVKVEHDAGAGSGSAEAPKPKDDKTCPVCNKQLKSAAGMRDHLKAKHPEYKPGTPVSTGGGDSPGPRGLHPLPNGYYKGMNPSKAEIGDLRITFSQVLPGKITILAAQASDTFSPFATPTGNLDELRSGILTSDAVFAAAEAENKMLTWLLRLVGFVLMGIGLCMIFKPLEVVADVVPFIGNIVGMGLGLAAFGIAAAISLCTIAIAWIFFRPLIGIPLLLCGVGLIVFLFMKSSSAAGAAADA